MKTGKGFRSRCMKEWRQAVTLLLICLSMILLTGSAAGEKADSTVWNYTENENGIVIQEYHGEEKMLSIPDVIDGKPVAALEDLGIQNEITEITVPDSVCILGNPFRGCFTLQAVHLSDQHVNARMLDGVLFSKDGRRLIRYPSEKAERNYTVPEGTESIESNAFADCVFLENLVLPDTLREIGAGAFSNCGRLTALEVPESVCAIHDGAFAMCGLKRIDLSGCSGLTKISRQLFDGCWQLAEILLPDSITEIGDSAFTFTAISSIRLPERVEIIGNNPFCNCGQLQRIEVAGEQDRYVFAAPFFIDEKEKRLICCLTDTKGQCIIPQVEEIGAYACYECTGLTGVVIPDSVEIIGDYAFSSCNVLQSVLIEAEKGLHIGRGSFSHNRQLAAVTVLGNVIAVDDDAFSGNELLAEIISDSAYIADYGRQHSLHVSLPWWMQ